jgi:hypothetical protein
MSTIYLNKKNMVWFISVISWRSVSFIGGGNRSNQRKTSHCQTLSYNVENMAGTSRHEWDSNYNYLVILFISIYRHNLMFHFILHTWISRYIFLSWVFAEWYYKTMLVSIQTSDHKIFIGLLYYQSETCDMDRWFSMGTPNLLHQ